MQECSPFNLKFNFTPIEAAYVSEIEQGGRKASLFRMGVPVEYAQQIITGLQSVI